MKGIKIILGITETLKPVWLRVFPYSFLKWIKMNVIKVNLKKMDNTKVEAFRRKEFPDGINLIGNIKAQTGLGESCRLVAAELRASGVPYSIYNYKQIGVMAEGNYSYDEHLSEEFPYNINVIHINPHEFSLAFTQLHEKAWNRRYNIGFWLWEMEEFPEKWIPCLNCVDEIWTPSEFTSKSIRMKTDKPVVTIPYYVEIELKRCYTRSEFGLPDDKFLFLMMYDRTSARERKNPRAVIEAYKQAFPEEEKVGLVIKISNSTKDELREIQSMLSGCKHVYFITELLKREQVNGLIHLVDTVVSLHRSEGFGLIMAEAMLIGTPVIATNWSANIEFMTKNTACLVDADLQALEHDINAFQKGSRWADADIGQAAGYMRLLYENPEYGVELAERAGEHIRECLSLERAVGLIHERLEAIYSGDGCR